MKNAERILIFTLFLFGYLQSPAQEVVSADSTDHPAISSALSTYTNAIKPQAEIFQGRDYVPYQYKLDNGHSFFKDEFWQKSDLVYRNTEYKNVQCVYDLVRDELIVRHYNRFSRVVLQKERVDEFTIAGHRFVYIKNDTTGLTPGYYDLLHDGKTRFLVRRLKNIEERASEKGMERKVYELRVFYVMKDGRLHVIRSKGDILDVYKDQSLKIKQLFRERRLNFRKQKEETVLAAAQLYDQLS